MRGQSENRLDDDHAKVEDDSQEKRPARIAGRVGVRVPVIVGMGVPMVIAMGGMVVVNVRHGSQERP